MLSSRAAGVLTRPPGSVLRALSLAGQTLDVSGGRVMLP
jgi:hypothetical protein